MPVPGPWLGPPDPIVATGPTEIVRAQIARRAPETADLDPHDFGSFFTEVAAAETASTWTQLHDPLDEYAAVFSLGNADAIHQLFVAFDLSFVPTLHPDPPVLPDGATGLEWEAPTELVDLAISGSWRMSIVDNSDPDDLPPDAPAHSGGLLHQVDPSKYAVTGGVVSFAGTWLTVADLGATPAASIAETIAPLGGSASSAIEDFLAAPITVDADGFVVIGISTTQNLDERPAFFEQGVICDVDTILRAPFTAQESRYRFLYEARYPLRQRQIYPATAQRQKPPRGLAQRQDRYWT